MTNLTLHRATFCDALFLRHLHNASLEYFSDSSKAGIVTHLKWMFNECHKQQTFILKHNRAKVGSIRINENQLSYAILPKYRNRGFATKMIKGYCQIITDKPIFATIKHSNMASMKVIEKCGFDIIARNDESYVFVLSKFAFVK